jgi:hypothetical protein
MVYVQQPSRLIGHLMENWKSSSLIANQAFEKIQERTLLGRLGGKQIHPSQCELISQDQIMFKYGGRRISIPESDRLSKVVRNPCIQLFQKFRYLSFFLNRLA